MKRISTIFALLVISICYLNMQDYETELRFIKIEYNYLFVSILCVLLPFSIFLRSLFFKEKQLKFAGVILSIVIGFPCFFIYVMSYSDYNDIRNNHYDSSLEKLNEITLNNYKYRLYRSNGGATTDYGLLLNKEYDFSFGIKSIKKIYGKYKAYNGSLIQLNNDTLQLKIDTYNDTKTELVNIKI